MVVDLGNIGEVVSALLAVAGTIGGALAAQKAAKPQTRATAIGPDTRLHDQIILEHQRWDNEVLAILATNRIRLRPPPNMDNLLED